MTNHIYYGEYSLKHWIELLLTRNIVLPEYQRSFVWDEADIKRLIKSLENKQFVQPVTIALYKTSNSPIPKNLLIDGQQRLTSILLAKLGYLPDREKFKSITEFASGDDSDNEDTTVTGKSIEWTFSEILTNGNNVNTIDSIKERLKSDARYIPFETGKESDFFENNFLGFSYIVPDTDDEREVQHDFAQLFRNINYFGKKLSPTESRKSLYFMDKGLRPYFEGITSDGSYVFSDLKIMENLKAVDLDFVRYLSILSQYKINNSSSKVMLGFSAYKARETYYADYVAYLLGLDQESRTDKFDGFEFSTIFPNNCWKARFDKLKDSILQLKRHFSLNEKNAFTSWIDADYWLFGLIYEIVFLGHTLDTSTDKLSKLVKAIIDDIDKKRKDPTYSKIPNGLGNIRQRLGESINVYKNYVH